MTSLGAASGRQRLRKRWLRAAETGYCRGPDSETGLEEGFEAGFEAEFEVGFEAGLLEEV